MLAVLGQGSSCGAASNQGVAVQAAVGPRPPQAGEDVVGGHKAAGHVASPTAFKSLQIPAPCCHPLSGQLLNLLSDLPVQWQALMPTDNEPLLRSRSLRTAVQFSTVPLRLCPCFVASFSHVKVSGGLMDSELLVRSVCG